jgi:hypothetical protein
MCWCVCFLFFSFFVCLREGECVGVCVHEWASGHVDTIQLVHH